VAIVTLKYLRSKAAVKAHTRYIVHRRVSAEHTISRPLFNETGLTDKQAVYKLIDAAPLGTIFYKIMISPDPKTEDTRGDLDLQHLLRGTIRNLEETLRRRLLFVAVAHNGDHTPIRHLHGIFLLTGRLTREEFAVLRKTAWQEATRQARRERRLLERVRENRRVVSLSRLFLPPIRPRLVRRAKGLLRRREVRLQPHCRHCGYGHMAGIPAFYVYCPACHKMLAHTRLPGLRREASL
jgi:hypothetical protein